MPTLSRSCGVLEARPNRECPITREKTVQNIKFHFKINGGTQFWPLLKLMARCFICSLMSRKLNNNDNFNQITKILRFGTNKKNFFQISQIIELEYEGYRKITLIRRVATKIRYSDYKLVIRYFYDFFLETGVGQFLSPPNFGNFFKKVGGEGQKLPNPVFFRKMLHKKFFLKMLSFIMPEKILPLS